MQDGCKDLKPWIKIISNHLYWCSSSTPSEDQDMMVAKWRSLGNHIQNVHIGHGENFPNSMHETLEGDGASRKKWLNQGILILFQVMHIMDITLPDTVKTIC